MTFDLIQQEGISCLENPHLGATYRQQLLEQTLFHLFGTHTNTKLDICYLCAGRLCPALVCSSVGSFGEAPYFCVYLTPLQVYLGFISFSSFNI